MQRKYHNFVFSVIISLFMTVFLISCSGSCKPSNTQQTTNIVAATLNGLVYQNNTVLPGNGAVSPTLGVASKIIFNNSGKFFICAGNSVLTPSINSWSLVNESSFDKNEHCDSIVTSNDHLYIGLYDDLNNGYVYESVAGSWQLLNNESVPGGSVVGLATNNSGVIYAGTNDSNTNTSSVYVSNDGSWLQVNSILPNNNQIDALSLDINNQLYVAVSNNHIGSVYLSSNGTWLEVGGGSVPDNSTIFSMTTDDNANLYVGTLAGHVYKLVGNLWQQVYTPPNFLAIEAMSVDHSSNTLYIANANGSVYKLINNAWIQINGTDVPDSAGVFGLAISPSGLVVAGTKNGNVYKSVNNEWQPMVTGSISNNLMLFYTYADQIGNMYAGGLESSGESAYVYSWSDNKWVIVNNSTLPYGGLVRSIATDNHNNLYVATYLSNSNITGDISGYVYESQNGAWSVVNNESFPSSHVISSMSINQQNNQLYIGTTNIDSLDVTNGAVYESVNGHWKMVNDRPLGTNSLGPIILNESGNLYAANGGYFGLLFQGIESNYVFESINGSWSLVNNRPIPDNDGVIIAMTTGSNGNIFVGTFDSFLDGSSSGSVYESVAGNWRVVNNSPMPDNGGVVSIQVDLNNNLYVGTFLGNVYESSFGKWILRNQYNTNMVSMTLKYTNN